jgi:hypothetical protein
MPAACSVRACTRHGYSDTHRVCQCTITTVSTERSVLQCSTLYFLVGGVRVCLWRRQTRDYGIPDNPHVVFDVVCSLGSVGCVPVSRGVRASLHSSAMSRAEQPSDNDQRRDCATRERKGGAERRRGGAVGCGAAERRCGAPPDAITMPGHYDMPSVGRSWVGGRCGAVPPGRARGIMYR